MLSDILKLYGIDNQSTVQPLTSGLINRTWKVSVGGKDFILQQINDQVFKNPRHLAANIRMISEFLKDNSPEYLFVRPVQTNEGDDLVFLKDVGYFRMFPFVSGSHSIDVVSSEDEAFEAAFQFGKFTKLLSGFEVGRLHITIPDFHNLNLRRQQFESAIKEGNNERIFHSRTLISELKDRSSIVTQFEKIRNSASFKRRVTHHDTKISNVLFDSQGKGKCVIDLDTVMPGYFISDVGDMMRTYLSPANEEEKDFSKIEVRDDFFRGIVHGYVTTMKDELSSAETDLFTYSGSFLTYMQALRFLTDYLNDDIYYGAKYEDHNFVRAGNQLELLKKLEEKKDLLDAIVSAELK
jgi:Ser/Thr protein kinase RdoA (MazF antagonist)